MPPENLTLDQILAQLQSMANPANIAGMQRFGIRTERALGISMPALRALAKGQRSHELALQLWDSGFHEARILASLIDDPRVVTLAQMEAWAADFDTWDVCDQVCSNLFVRTPYAMQQSLAWSQRPEEYVCRAGFVLMAELATHAKRLPDETFLQFMPLIIQHSTDSRNFVRKAVNWALRGIGKRSPSLRQAAMETARQIQQIDDRTARWIASDALRELEKRAG